MPQLTWGDVGERFYELGVDRGVLYPLVGDGVAWNGIISVDEAPNMEQPNSYYYDGIMYLQVPRIEEFRATITAMHRPSEFAASDGVATGLNGMLITQQRRKPFGFSYRTLVGNDLENEAHGYRIHLVYNALAMPSSRNYQSMGGGVNPSTYSWEITAKPPAMDGYRRTPHLVIDSLTAPPATLAALEDILYGTTEDAPRLPLPMEIFEMGFGIIVTDNGDGTFTISGPDDLVYLTDPDEWEVISASASYLDADTYTISSI
jgi:hypothetical protein